jgi:hypothetical protein
MLAAAHAGGRYTITQRAFFPVGAHDRLGLLGWLLGMVALLAAATFTLMTTQGALHGGGEVTRGSDAVEMSAYLDNGGVPWHFEVRIPSSNLSTMDKDIWTWTLEAEVTGFGGGCTQVVYSVMQYAKRAHKVRSFVMSDSFVAFSDRKALLAACMADETITLVAGIPTLRGNHPGNSNSAIGAFTAELCTRQL